MTIPLLSRPWRRVPHDGLKYEWITLKALPPSLMLCAYLIHHGPDTSEIIARVVQRRKDSLRHRSPYDDVYAIYPEAKGAPAMEVSHWRFYSEVLLPPLIDQYGFDRGKVGRALYAQLPPALHNEARTVMRHTIYARQQAARRKDPNDVFVIAGEILLDLLTRMNALLTRFQRRFRLGPR